MSQERPPSEEPRPFDYEVTPNEPWDYKTFMGSSHTHVSAVCAALIRGYSRSEIGFKNMTKTLAASACKTGKVDWKVLDKELTIWLNSHRAFYSEYTNEKAILRHLKRKGVVKEDCAEDEHDITVAFQNITLDSEEAAKQLIQPPPPRYLNYQRF